MKSLFPSWSGREKTKAAFEVIPNLRFDVTQVIQEEDFVKE